MPASVLSSLKKSPEEFQSKEVFEGPSAEIRRALVRAGEDPAAVALRIAPLALAEREPPPGGAVLVAAIHDRVVPLAHLDRLANAWRAPVELHPAGHMSIYLLPRLLRRLRDAIGSWETGAHG